VHLADGGGSRHHDSAEQRPGRAAHLGAPRLLTCDATGVLSDTLRAHASLMHAACIPSAHRCGAPRPADAAGRVTGACR
jgi:hypothetical protein